VLAEIKRQFPGTFEFDPLKVIYVKNKVLNLVRGK